MKRHRLRCLYSDNVFLLTGIDHDQYIRFITKNYPDYTITGPGLGSGRMEDPVHDGIQHVFIWVDEELDADTKRLVAIHEAVHAVMSILYDAGVPISKHNDEAFAYLLDDLCRQLFQKLGV